MTTVGLVEAAILIAAGPTPVALADLPTVLVHGEPRVPLDRLLALIAAATPASPRRRRRTRG